MDALKVAIPVDVAAATVTATAKVMNSDIVIGARVCSSDSVEHRGDSDGVSPLSTSKIDDFRGATAGGSSSWIRKTDAELCRSNCLSSRSLSDDASFGLVNGISSGSTMLMSEYEVKQIQRKVGKVPRNGSGSFKKPRVLQSDNLLPQAEADDAKTESEKLGLPLIKCSNADKSQAAKQKNNINGRRGDRRNSKAPMKAKFDPFSQKVGLSNFSSASGGSSVFGMYGLKPDIQDVSKLLDDISLDELLDGTYKCPNSGKDKGKKASNVTDIILNSVKRACSVIRLRGVQQSKQADDIDVHVNKNMPSLSSPSNNSVVNGCDGDDSTLPEGLAECGKDMECSINIESSADKKDVPLYQPRDILQRLALPPPKDLDSLLQDAVVSTKLSDSRSGKQLSHRVSLPAFSWSHNFSGHYKSNNDAIKVSNRSTCQGRWVRLWSNASFNGGGNEDFMDLDSLTYDNSLVPAGQLIYQLPEIVGSSAFINQQCCQQKSSGAVCPTSTASLPPPESGSTIYSKLNALHSPRILAAAQTLCDLASDSSTRISNGILKWPKQPSQKAMKARKSRSSEKSEEFLTPKSESLPDHVVRGTDNGSSSKKPRISMVDRREDYSHVHTVVGLSSISAPRSNRSSPSRLSRDSMAEARHVNGSFIKPSSMAPPPPRVLDRSHHNPQKLKKVSPMDWNRTKG